MIQNTHLYLGIVNNVHNSQGFFFALSSKTVGIYATDWAVFEFWWYYCIEEVSIDWTKNVLQGENLFEK